MSNDVQYVLDIEGAEGRWAIRSVDIQEALNEPFEVTITARVADAHPEAADLRGKSCTLTLERSEHQRTIKGVVRTARVHERLDGVQVRFVLVPALWYLGQNRDSRIYQDKTAPEIAEELYRRHLGGLQRTIRNDLTRSYPRHEYVAQYQESDLAFLTRLCEQEGFFFFFDHEEADREVLVLADASRDLPSVHEGAVRFWHDPAQAPSGEVVFAASHHERLGTTDVVVSEYNWTRPGAAVRGERTDRGQDEPAIEDYDHTDAVALYDYRSRGYEGNDANLQAQMRAERLDLDRQRWSMRTTVVSAQPGKLLELAGCPEGALDGRRYLIVAVHGTGEGTDGARGSYENGLDCVPVDVPYRPARKTPRPMVHGPETAVVVGPAGEEIHTDEHGRIKVHFHWDRQGGRDERSSCWLRAAQMWAGPGWGTLFLPRIGMEVVVQFLGGNPDRPIVTGCLYNGDNGTPYALPDEKTKSTIKSNSSPGGGGFNELRFEDKAGREEIFLHAQRNLVERVLNDHTTHVGHDQRETVDNDQELTVHGNRTKTVDGNETIVVKGTRDARIGEDGGDDKLWVINNQQTQVDGNRSLEVAFGDTIHVRGMRTDTVDSGVTTSVAQGVRQTIRDGGWTMTTTGNVIHGIQGEMATQTSGSINMVSGTGTTIQATDTVSVSGQSITLQSNTSVTVNAPAGITNITPAAERNVLVQSFHDAADAMENIGSKLSAYAMAIAIYGVKVDIVGLKTEVYGIKLDEAGLKASKGVLELRNLAAAAIQRASATIIG